MNPPINLSDLETLINSLLAEGKCACHIINPHKTRILLWKLANGTYHLRIGIQKFSSSDQKDRNGETYWRFWNCEIEPIPTPNQPEKEHERPNPTESETNSTPA